MFALNAAIQHLTTMDAASTPTLTQLNTIGSGAKILPTLLRSSSTPMATIITATVMPGERYSNRPWPVGMLRVGGSVGKLESPSRLIRLLDASDRLFTASAMIATEPLSRPATSLPAKSSTLQPMPTMLAALP